MPFDSFDDTDVTRPGEQRSELPMGEYLRRRFPVEGSVYGERERGYQEYLRRIKK